MRRPALCALLAILPIMPFACRPELGERESLITRTQVLAVRGEPPEAKTGDLVVYSLLVATPDGPIATPLANWAFCHTPKLLTENGVANTACLGDGVLRIVDGLPEIQAFVPPDACSVFGPEIASADLRPRDPDVTGGFYQPLRVTVFGPSYAVDGPTVAYGLERVACKLANASADVSTEFARRHVNNKNPELGPLTATRDGRPIALTDVPLGATITLHATWPEPSAEHYVVYDLASRTVVDRRESMRVSWFATAGAFANDRTGRADTELETFTDNEWTAPADARTTHLFVVLRDARGGTAYATYDVVTR